MPGPDILGDRQSEQDVRSQNIAACRAIANIVKSSLGPVGLDKPLVDDIGDVTITKDGATILRMLELEHRAAKVDRNMNKLIDINNSLEDRLRQLKSENIKLESQKLHATRGEKFTFRLLYYLWFVFVLIISICFVIIRNTW